MGKMYSRILIWCGRRKVDVHGSGKRSHWIVWSDGDIVRFCHSGYFPHFEQSTTDADVRLNNISTLRSDEVEKFKTGV